MAFTPLQLQLFILTSVFFSTSIATNTRGGVSTASPLLSPSSPPLFQEHAYPSSLFGPILASLGFHGFSAAAASLSNNNTWRGPATPATIFAPTDSSLLTCPSCSVPLLLHEHTLPGIFPVNYMRTLAFGTKIETLAPGRCITITFSNASEVFISGVKITRPDMYNDGVVAVHGLQGFVSHLSPYSCDVERMTSLSFPRTPPFFLMRLMLKDAMLRLRISGYGVVALALRVKYPQLLNLQTMTVFALDDAAIFSGSGYSYVTNFRFHIVPNKLLTAADFESLSAGTLLPTMEPNSKLVVTTAGVTGVPKAPISINHVMIKIPDLMHNLKIVVHGLSSPFQHIYQSVAGDRGQIERSGEDVGNSNIREMVAPTAAIESIVDIDDHHGL
ncbi:hypothetical protein U1Q18_001864 [Sarracenia purpurea var. burkii]